MKITCITPVYDYIEGATRLSTWVKDELSRVIPDYYYIIFNDNEKFKTRREYLEISEYENFHVHHVNKNTGDLRIPLSLATQVALFNGSDAVLTIESDAVPNIETFLKMLHVYNNPYLKPVGSVSPMYSWEGKRCYPTHNHWYYDGIGRPDGRHDYNYAGMVSDVGSPGVPFLFSLWNPVALSLINKATKFKMEGLDGELGKMVHDKGFHHLRLLQADVEHFGGGMRSWHKR